MTKAHRACDKCRDYSDGQSVMTEGGVAFIFCKTCIDLLEFCPNIRVAQFLGPKEERCVPKNTITARRRKEYGDYRF
jgi:hypothetical protein